LTQINDRAAHVPSSFPAMDIAALIAKYDVRVPRYTSYPTAPHFTAAVDAATYRGWLASLPDDAPVSLYLHVPFCDQLCWYCGCHTVVVHQRAPLDAYAGQLLAEIDLLAEAIGRRPTLAHVVWGGGTPHALPAEHLLAVMRRLRQAFAFAADTAVEVEMDPRTATPATLDALAAMEITRASLGVQDFDPAVQRAVNRVQSFAVTQACVEGLRARGVASINLDLMYGLPHQSEASVTAAAEQALALAPDRVAVFGYAHVPWMKRHQALLAEASLPGPLQRYRQLLAAERALTGAGFIPIGLDHYARPGDDLARAAAEQRLHRNFQGYTTDAAPVLLGLGASAIGSLPQGYVQNAAALAEYAESVRAGRLPTRRGIALGDEDRLRRAVIERIMCHGQVDLGATASRHGADAAKLRQAAAALAPLVADGLVEWDGNRVTVRPEARPFLRNVAAVFDAYWRPEETRHAYAV
jgi:oxygen-independent coproporphyrinogen-3 oxidase